jgi:hypothetical protein
VALSSSLLAAVGAPLSSAPLFNLLAIPLCSQLFRRGFQWLFTSPAVRQRVGRLWIAAICLVGGMSLLVFAALCTSSSSRLGLIYSYLVEVHLATLLREALLPMLLYCTESYTAIRVLGRPLLQVGLYNFEVFCRDRIRRDKRYVAYSVRVLPYVWLERARKQLVSGGGGAADDLYDTFSAATSLGRAVSPIHDPGHGQGGGVELSSSSGGAAVDEGFAMENPLLALKRSSVAPTAAASGSAAEVEGDVERGEGDLLGSYGEDGDDTAYAAADTDTYAYDGDDSGEGRDAYSLAGLSARVASLLYTAPASAAAPRTGTGPARLKSSVRSSFWNKVQYFESNAFHTDGAGSTRGSSAPDEPAPRSEEEQRQAAAAERLAAMYSRTTKNSGASALARRGGPREGAVPPEE